MDKTYQFENDDEEKQPEDKLMSIHVNDPPNLHNISYMSKSMFVVMCFEFELPIEDWSLRNVVQDETIDDWDAIETKKSVFDRLNELMNDPFQRSID